MNKTISYIIGALVIFAARPAAAQWNLGDQDLRVSVYYESAFLLGGRAGRFDLAAQTFEPDLKNLYGPGYGGRVELGWRFEPEMEALVGVGYILYSGGVDRLGQEGKDRVIIELGDFTAVPVYAGIKYLFSDDPSEGFIPFARLDAGYIFSSPVNANIAILFADPLKQPIVVENRWWRADSLFTWDIGGGLEYRRGNFGFFTEVLYQSYGKPDKAYSAVFQSAVITSDGSKWAPTAVRGGVAYYF